MAHITTGTRLTDTEQFLRMPFFREVGVGVTSILMPTRFGQQMNAPCQNIVLGGFQLLDLIITELKSHMTMLKIQALSLEEILFVKKILYKICSSV